LRKFDLIGAKMQVRLPPAALRLRSAHWVKVKNPKAPAVTREAEEDWGR
jgi:hypothetical protein